MRPLVQLKRDLEFNQDLGGIIGMLKIAATAQLRRQRVKTDLHEPFLARVLGAAAPLDLHGIRHPFLVERSHLPACLVVLTSDEGFAGDLNSRLITTALGARDAARGDRLVVLGERGAALLEELNEPFVAFPGVAEEIDRREVRRVKGYLVKEYLGGGIGAVRLVYAKFVSVTSQQVEEESLLPARSLLEQAKRPGARRPPCLVEPSAERVAEGLIHLWLEYRLASAFISSKLSELSARVMRLEGSDQALTRMSQELRFAYVKHLHALADTSIREISASRLKVARS